MGPISQAVAVTGVSLRSIGQRWGAALVTVFGVAGVVTVFLAVLSIGEGFRATLASTGAPDRVLVLRSGANDEMSSMLDRESVRVIQDTPGVLHDAGGPVASGELFVIVDVPKRSTGTDANVPLRGVPPEAFRVRDEIRIVEGRNFNPGSNEIIVGSGAAGQYAGLTVGATLVRGKNEWRVVGIFDGGGTIADSEIWSDRAVLAPAYRRGDTVQSVFVKLGSADAFGAFKDALTTNPRLNVKVVRESEYYEEKSRTLTEIVRYLGYPIALLMGIGAIFGALNTMYSAVASRTREIATLRALGFRGGAVVASVIAEATLLGVVGGLVGGGLGWLAFDGFRTSTLNWQTFSMVAFSFRVTLSLLVQGTVYALLIGLVGGVFPAVRAARLPVATALREL